MSGNTDTARIDYLQQHRVAVSCAPACDEPWAVLPRSDISERDGMFTGETLRSAIDAAMAGE